MDVVENLAMELHRQYRAADKALGDARHDHGWRSCADKKYFRNRARLVIARATCTDPQTLGQAEENLNALVLKRRLIVEGKG